MTDRSGPNIINEKKNKMRIFQNVQDLGDLRVALDEAFEIKKDRFKYHDLGRNKTALLIFFNNSLRTRLSTQKAALNLGMNGKFTQHFVGHCIQRQEIYSLVLICR